MHQHRMSMRRLRMAGLVATFAAFMAAIVVAPTATAADVTGTLLGGNPSIVAVNGIKQLIPGGHIMNAADVGGGVFQTPNTVTAYNPQGFGILTWIMSDHLVGPIDPGYDQSKAIGVDNALAQIRQDQANNPKGRIVYVGHSQGSDVGVQVISVLEKSGANTSNMVFVLAANPDRADGGIKTRFDFLPPIFIPLLGVTVGGQQPTTSDHTQVLEVTREYDGFADFPVYPLNGVADLNALAGMVVLHSNYDQINLNDSNAVFTHSANGMITDELIPTPLVPLLMVAVQFGLPAQTAQDLDPALRSIINAGYNRQDVVPTQAVPFKLFPSLPEIQVDTQNISNGFQQTVQALANHAISAPVSTPPQVNALVSNQPPTNEVQLQEPRQPQGLSQVQSSSQQTVAQPQLVSQPAQQSVVQEPVTPKGPVLNSVRNGLGASSGTRGTSPGRPNSFSSSIKGGDGASLGPLSGVVKSVQGAIHNALHPATSSAGTTSHGAAGSPSSSSSN